MQNFDQKVLVGKIIGAHGIKGEVHIKALSNDAQILSKLKKFYDQNNKELANIRFKSLKKGIWIAKIDNINSRNEAELIKNTELFVQRIDMPALKDNEYYHCDLFGLKIINQNNEEIGIVNNLYNFGANDIIEITLNKDNKQVMLPFVMGFIISVDFAKKQIIMNIPENLLTDKDDKDE